MADLINDLNLANARFKSMPSGVKAAIKHKQLSANNWNNGDCPVCHNVFCVFKTSKKYGEILICHKCGHRPSC